MDICVFLLIW